MGRRDRRTEGGREGGKEERDLPALVHGDVKQGAGRLGVLLEGKVEGGREERREGGVSTSNGRLCVCEEKE